MVIINNFNYSLQICRDEMHVSDVTNVGINTVKQSPAPCPTC